MCFTPVFRLTRLILWILDMLSSSVGRDHDRMDRRTGLRSKARIPGPVFAPEPGGDVVVILADQRESTETVLLEALD